jgi:hypothetical protein
VGQRRKRRLAAEQRVAQLKQGIGAAGERAVQLAPERAEPRKGEGGIGMAAQPDPPDGDRQPEQGNALARVKSQA